MSILIFFLFLAISAAAIAYPLLPGPKAHLLAAYRAPVVDDQEIERAVRRLRLARGRDGLSCPACGAAYQAGDRFCVDCGGELPGAAVPPGVRACPSCQAPIGPDDSFCPKCGTAIRTGEAT